MAEYVFNKTVVLRTITAHSSDLYNKKLTFTTDMIDMSEYLQELEDKSDLYKKLKLEWVRVKVTGPVFNNRGKIVPFTEIYPDLSVFDMELYVDKVIELDGNAYFLLRAKQIKLGETKCTL